MLKVLNTRPHFYSSFVHPDLLWPYEDFKDKYIMKDKIPEGFEDAIEEIEAALKRRKAKVAGVSTI